MRGMPLDADHTRPTRVRPDDDAIARARHRDDLADEIARCRQAWTEARSAVDQADRDYRLALRAEVLAGQAFHAAHVAYDAAPR